MAITYVSRILISRFTSLVLRLLYICICSSIWLNQLITRALRGRSVRSEIYGGQRGIPDISLLTYHRDAHAIVARLWTRQYRLPLHCVTANAASLLHLCQIKIIARHFLYGPPKVVGQMPYLPHRLRRPCIHSVNKLVFSAP